MVEKSPYLNCTENEFYKHYQVNRNICYAGKNDIVLFLTLRANDARGLEEGREYIDKFSVEYPNIRNIYWEDLVAEIMKHVSDTELADYYCKFKEKYIDIL